MCEVNMYVEIYEKNNNDLRLIGSRIFTLKHVKLVPEDLRNAFNKEGFSIAISTKANKCYIIYKYDDLSDMYKTLYKLDMNVFVNYILENLIGLYYKG